MTKTLVIDSSITLIVSDQLFDRIHNNKEELIEFVFRNTFKNNSRYINNATSKEQHHV